MEQYFLPSDFHDKNIIKLILISRVNNFIKRVVSDSKTVIYFKLKRGSGECSGEEVANFVVL